MLPWPPLHVKLSLVGETTKPHCTMVKTCPRTEIVPTRKSPLLACTVKPTLPLPTPLPGLATVIQPALGTASQWHPAPVMILNELVPPSTGYCQLLGLRANVQLA